MANSSSSSSGTIITDIKVEDPELNAEQRILELCAHNPNGITDSVLRSGMPQVTDQQRLAALNRLLSLGKLDLLKSAQSGILYRLKSNLDPSSLMTNNSDMDEKLVYTVIKESNNKGIWIRDISTKTNVKSALLNKTLKNLETKKLIKSITSVNASKKKVYMLFELEPDRSITGGAWYSGKEFESEFVEILNEQCYRYLCEKKEHKSANFVLSAVADPILKKNASFVSSKEIRDYIKDLGISKVELNIDDIETILNTLVFDGKCERSIVSSASSSLGAKQETTISLYRAIEPILKSHKGSALIRTPCGICHLIDNCHQDGIISPSKCVYMKEWLDF